MLKLAASEPFAQLIVGATMCTQSLFLILKTDEIKQFQEQIWALIEGETAAQMNRESQTPQPGMVDGDENEMDSEGDNETVRSKNSSDSQAAKPAAAAQSYYSWMFGTYPANDQKRDAEDIEEEET